MKGTSTKGLTLEWVLNNKEKYNSWGKDFENMPCKDCGGSVNPFESMVMLKDKLWTEICDEFEDIICDKCIEKRMGREIQIEDFKPHKWNEFELIPCNAFWLEHKEKLNEISNN